MNRYLNQYTTGTLLLLVVISILVILFRNTFNLFILTKFSKNKVLVSII
jgi:hypothetical protein